MNKFNKHFIYFLLFFLSFECISKENLLDVLSQNKRFLPQNFIHHYGKVKRAIKNCDDKESLIFSIFDARKRDELFWWNYFFLLDMVDYYEMEEDFGIKNVNDFLKLRDQAYGKWVDSLDWRFDHSFLDKSNSGWSGVSLDKYLKAKGTNFRPLEILIAPFNRPPHSRKFPGRKFAYDLIGAKLPVNAIFVKNIFEKFKVIGINRIYDQISCIQNRISLNGDQVSLDEILSECKVSKVESLFIFGALSSQRMYLIRDMMSWVRDNFSISDATKIYQIFVEGSKIYFGLESLGRKLGTKYVYPNNNFVDFKKLKLNEPMSSKPYHFYSVAYIAYEMALRNFEKDAYLVDSRYYARKYKKTVSKIAIPYHLLLGVNIRTGTVKDKNQVLNEQILGSYYGAFLFEAK